MEEILRAREIREERGEGRETYTKTPIDRHTQIHGHIDARFIKGRNFIIR